MHRSGEAGRALVAAARARGQARLAAGRRAARALDATLGASVVALVLLGSYARRRARVDSDLDVVLVTREPLRARPLLQAGRVELDLRLASLAELQRDGFPPWLCVGPVPVLFDPEGHARRALRVARALYAAGPPPLSRAQLATHRAWAARMERRIRAELSPHPALAALRLARLRVRLAELYFEARALWPRADRAALDHWTKHDPAVVRILERVAAAPSPVAELAALHELARAALGSR